MSDQPKKPIITKLAQEQAEMSNRTKYTNLSTVVLQLKNEIKACMIHGIKSLPSERVLTQKFMTSRNTLRKALHVLIGEGCIIQEGYKKTIMQLYQQPLENCRKIVFIASGTPQRFALQAVERLWHTLQSLLLKRSNLTLCLLSENYDFNASRNTIKDADVILIGDHLWCNNEAMLADLCKNKPVIRLIDYITSYFPAYIMLDNYEVGRLAAEVLLQQGCKKIFAMWEICPNIDFENRARGFSDVLLEKGQGGLRSIFWVPRENNAIISEMTYRMKWAIAHGYDGVFLMSDENIGEIINELIMDKSIPNQLKVVSTDGTHAALRHSPSITCISHATEGIAIEVYEQLKAISLGKYKGVKKKIHPVCYYGDMDAAKK